MSFIAANTEDPIVLQLFVKSKDGQLANQDSPLPKVTIYRMDGTTATEVLAATTMVEHVDGEYQYSWTVPTTPGMYKAKYETLINNITYYSYDTIHAKIPEDKYSGEGV